MVPYSIRLCYIMEWEEANNGQVVGCSEDQPCSQYQDGQYTCDTYTGWYDDGGGGGADDGSNGGAGDGSGNTGGGGGGYTNPTQPPAPCVPTAYEPRKTAQAKPAPPCDNGGTGWEPVPVPVPDPYDELTVEEKTALDNLIAEEQAVDEYFRNPSPCHGTARMGNMYFQGTMEHRLVQLDFLAQHPISGDREYAIPNAGAAGNTYGFADVVNTATKEIFEIKPMTQNAAGLAEVENYVLKANLSCLNAGTPGLTWTKGASAGIPSNICPGPKIPQKFCL